MRLLSSLSLFSIALPLAAAALDPSTMTNHLAAGAPLLGAFEQSTSNLSSWMSSLSDSTPIQNLSIPGTHDTLTWNVSGIASIFTKTQDMPLFRQLDAGARFIDLRIGENNGLIQLYHASFLLDPTAQLVDVFWGLYHWLDAHPTETVIVSVKVDTGNTTATLEQAIYDLVTGPDAVDYWVQSTTLPTLGQARHKAILLRRFAFTLLPTATPVGIDASSGWSDNNATFTIPYGTGSDAIYIEDLYDINGTSVADVINNKFAAVSAHLDVATSTTYPNQLFITFVSGSSGTAVTPLGLAEGNGTTTPGANLKTLSYLAGKKGSRFGVVLFDYIGSDSRLVPATLSQPVDLSAAPRSVSAPTATGTTGTTSTRPPSSNWASSGLALPHQAVALVVGVTFATMLSFF
ncbi:hypothetical protein BOTBODRAFT_46677 [Botryobasidium botryosum FD-172 SS1]|uniref:Phosphatidylinositol-specific phospholipase C X domain-containing protein n=1 Tax=Botryobasidium botryosum (strain FD-172 SS1) TaxID=930990 RepID=A0A067M5X8_BOTB1|nr:hypothetical protein BOTBODRAFT_46677 [Botryobasidium botryosum FD-172 SS1]